MTVRRIVANLAVGDTGPGRAFYADVLGLSLAMDLGWIATLAGDGASHPQLSLMTEGGSGAPVPRLSVEVDDIDAVLERVRAAGIPVDYGPVVEPWGVRRFFVRDPDGHLVNVLMHA